MNLQLIISPRGLLLRFIIPTPLASEPFPLFHPNFKYPFHGDNAIMLRKIPDDATAASHIFIPCPFLTHSHTASHLFILSHCGEKYPEVTAITPTPIKCPLCIGPV